MDAHLAKIILAVVTAISFIITIIFHLSFWCVLWAMLLFCAWAGFLKYSILPRKKNILYFHLFMMAIALLNLIIASLKVFFYR